MSDKTQLWDELASVLSSSSYQSLSDAEINEARNLWGRIRANFGMSDDEVSQLHFLSSFNTMKEANPLEIIGTIEWYLYKDQQTNTWGGAFNGQEGRTAIFRELMEHVSFQAIVETGTFRGDSTEFMARSSGLPLYTTESHSRYYAFAKNRLRETEGVFVAREDSRSFLGRLAMDPFFPKDRIFFYLDAHWEEDLPLRDEVFIIAHNWSEFAIMIDDFQVPDDPGYTFDDYDNGNVLCLDYLMLDELKPLQVYWPSLPSDKETGKRRGCAIITSDGLLERVDQPLKTLRRAS